METVAENSEHFTLRQIERAKQARALHQLIGTLSIRDLKAVIQMNCIANNPVTVEDINVAEKIFGPDIGVLKGKSTRTKPLPVVRNHVKIPAEIINNHADVDLCMDTLKINGLPFLATVSKKSCIAPLSGYQRNKANLTGVHFPTLCESTAVLDLTSKEFIATTNINPLWIQSTMILTLTWSMH